ncbi:MAG: hypothetical protein ACRES9_09675 [Gammaproteobacteria bacterium]
MKRLDTWETLQNTWQSAAAPTIDLPALRRQAQRKRRRMFRNGALEILLTTAFTCYLAIAGAPANLHAGPVLPWLFVAAAWIEVLVKTWLRLVSWNVKNLGTAGLLELHVRRARAGIAFAWTSVIALLVAYALWVLIFWRLWLSGQPGAHDTVIAGLVASGIFFVLAAWTIRCALRQRRKLRHAQTLLDQLCSEGESP